MILKMSTMVEASSVPVIQNRFMDESAMFGNRVKTAREKLGLTLAEASRRSKMSPQKFQDAENGADSRGTTVAAIARGLDVSADFLLGVVPEPRHSDGGERRPRLALAPDAAQARGETRPSAQDAAVGAFDLEAHARSLVENVARERQQRLDEEGVRLTAAARRLSPEEGRANLSERLQLLRRDWSVVQAAAKAAIPPDGWERAERGEGMDPLSLHMVGMTYQVSTAFLVGLTENSEPLELPVNCDLLAPPLDESGNAFLADEATPPAASYGSQLRSNSIFYRLESLEADAVDNLRIAKKTRALDAALRALLDFEALPKTLRDQLREALGTDESGQS